MKLLFLTESYLSGVFLDYYRQALVDDLAHKGLSVYVVKTNVPGMSASHLNGICQQVKPDVVFSINAAGIALLPPQLDAERIIWFIDSYDRMQPDWVPFFQHRGVVFLTGINRYIDRFKQRFPAVADRVYTVPFGAGVQFVTSPAYASRETEVFFVGTAFGGAHGTGVLASALAKLSEEDRPGVCQAIEHHVEHYDFEIGDCLKKHENPDLKPHHDSFHYRCMVDDVLSVQKRMHYLAALADSNMAIYGDSSEGWIAHILMVQPQLLSRFQFKPITDPNALASYYGHSKMALNVQHHQAFNFGLSWRVFDIMACGSLLLTERQSVVPLAALGFEENTHFVAFSSAEDLRQKVSYFSQHTAEAEAMINTAKQKISQGHLLTHRVSHLLDGAKIAWQHLQNGQVVVVDAPWQKPTKHKTELPVKLTQKAAFHLKTNVGKKYYLKLELLHR